MDLHLEPVELRGAGRRGRHHRDPADRPERQPPGGPRRRQDLGTIRSDGMKLRQALLNLLSNAAKFTEKGTITLTADRAASRVRKSC